jgi:hypothetical protein
MCKTISHERERTDACIAMHSRNAFAAPRTSIGSIRIPNVPSRFFFA